MACDKFLCQSLHWGSKNQVQKHSKKIKSTTSSCTKGFGGHREQNVKQRPECKLYGECNQRRGSEGGGNWCRKKKELRQNCVWRWPCLQSSAGTVQGDHGVAVWKVSQQQPKGGSGRSAALHCHPDHWAKILPMDVCSHPWVSAKHITIGPTHSITQRPEGRKWGHTEWIWGRSWSAAPVGELATHRTGHSRNKGQVRPKPWKWVTRFVTYTHISEKGQFFVHHFVILSPSF